MNEFKSILVIAPHPDDESIGCGGTIAKYARNGSMVKVVFLTSGENGGHGIPVKETVRTREREAAAAAAILGVDRYELWRFPDGGLRASVSLVNRLTTEIKNVQPRVILAPYALDMHADHRTTIRALKKIHFVSFDTRPTILMYEVWTPVRRIDHIEDITNEISIKLRAIKSHKTQTSVVGFVEAFRGLARYRGEMHSWPGGPYAEVFERLEI